MAKENRAAITPYLGIGPMRIHSKKQDAYKSNNFPEGDVTLTRRGQTFSDTYRTVEESRILDILTLAGFAFATDPQAARTTAAQALAVWAGDGLGSQKDVTGQRLFDPVEVVCHLKTAERTGRDDFWRQHYTETGRRLVSDLPPSLSAPVQISYRRLFNTAHAVPGKPLRLRLPMPLASRSRLINIWQNE